MPPSPLAAAPATQEPLELPSLSAKSASTPAAYDSPPLHRRGGGAAAPWRLRAGSRPGPVRPGCGRRDSIAVALSRPAAAVELQAPRTSFSPQRREPGAGAVLRGARSSRAWPARRSRETRRRAASLPAPALSQPAPWDRLWSCHFPDERPTHVSRPFCRPLGPTPEACAQPGANERSGAVARLAVHTRHVGWRERGRAGRAWYRVAELRTKLDMLEAELADVGLHEGDRGAALR